MRAALGNMWSEAYHTGHMRDKEVQDMSVDHSAELLADSPGTLHGIFWKGCSHFFSIKKQNTNENLHTNI